MTDEEKALVRAAMDQPYERKVERALGLLRLYERKATELASAAWEDKSCVSYHCHNGNHDLVRDDWNVYLAHAEKHWK